MFREATRAAAVNTTSGIAVRHRGARTSRAMAITTWIRKMRPAPPEKSGDCHSMTYEKMSWRSRSRAGNSSKPGPSGFSAAAAVPTPAHSR